MKDCCKRIDYESYFCHGFDLKRVKESTACLVDSATKP